MAIDAEGELVRASRDGQCRAERGDSADAGRHVSDLEDLAVCEGETIDVVDGVGVGDEVQAAAVLSPVRVDIFCARNTWQRVDRPRLHVDRCQPEFTERQRLERRGETVGRKRDRPAIRRPGRVEIGKRIGRERTNRRGLEVDHVEIAEAVVKNRKRDPLAVGRPRRAEHLIHVSNGQLALHAAGCGVEDRQHGRAARKRGHHQALAVRRPRACRLDELQALEMRIAFGFDDLAANGPRSRIGDDHVDRVLTAIGEVGDRPSVRAQRRTDAEPRIRAFSPEDGGRRFVEWRAFRSGADGGRRCFKRRARRSQQPRE